MKTEEMVDKTSTLSIARAPPSDLTDERKIPNLEVDKHSNRVASADATEAAVALANKGDLEEARKLLNNAISAIKASPSASDEMCKGLISQLETSLAGLKTRESYSRQGQYSMNQCYKAMKMQRCAAPAQMECESLSYETSKR